MIVALQLDERKTVASEAPPPCVARERREKTRSKPRPSRPLPFPALAPLTPEAAPKKNLDLRSFPTSSTASAFRLGHPHHQTNQPQIVHPYHLPKCSEAVSCNPASSNQPRLCRVISSCFSDLNPLKSNPPKRRPRSSSPLRRKPPSPSSAPSPLPLRSTSV